FSMAAVDQQPTNNLMMHRTVKPSNGKVSLGWARVRRDIKLDDQNKVKSSDILVWNNHHSIFNEEEGVSENQALELKDRETVGDKEFMRYLCYKCPVSAMPSSFTFRWGRN